MAYLLTKKKNTVLSKQKKKNAIIDFRDVKPSATETNVNTKRKIESLET